MPANLPAEAKAAWLKVIEAKTPEEKLKAMEEFLSTVPKHKGTEKLIKHVRRRMAELKKELQERREKEKSLRSGSTRLYVAKEGDLQVAVIGPPSSGKTSLLRCLTNTSLEPDDLPFSTVEPIPSMFVEDGVYVQLVKTPSLVVGQPSDLNTITFATARNADAVFLVLESGVGVDTVEKIFQFLKMKASIYTDLLNMSKLREKASAGFRY